MLVLYVNEPIPAHVVDRTLGVLGGLFLERLRAAHGGMNLSTHKAYERLDGLIVVDRGEKSQRTARRRHADAWYLAPLDNRHGAVHEVQRGWSGEVVAANPLH